MVKVCTARDPESRPSFPSIAALMGEDTLCRDMDAHCPPGSPSSPLARLPYRRQLPSASGLLSGVSVLPSQIDSSWRSAVLLAKQQQQQQYADGLRVTPTSTSTGTGTGTGTATAATSMQLVSGGQSTDRSASTHWIKATQFAALSSATSTATAKTAPVTELPSVVEQAVNSTVSTSVAFSQRYDLKVHTHALAGTSSAVFSDAVVSLSPPTPSSAGKRSGRLLLPGVRLYAADDVSPSSSPMPPTPLRRHASGGTSAPSGFTAL
jgi:hypothetical protein